MKFQQRYCIERSKERDNAENAKLVSMLNNGLIDKYKKGIIKFFVIVGIFFICGSLAIAYCLLK